MFLQAAVNRGFKLATFWRLLLLALSIISPAETPLGCPSGTQDESEKIQRCVNYGAHKKGFCWTRDVLVICTLELILQMDPAAGWQWIVGGFGVGGRDHISKPGLAVGISTKERTN